MSTTTDFRASSAARPTADRLADGVVAGYIRRLATTSTRPQTNRPIRHGARAHESGRAASLPARRRPARLRVPTAV